MIKINSLKSLKIKGETFEYDMSRLYLTLILLYYASVSVTSLPSSEIPLFFIDIIFKFITIMVDDNFFTFNLVTV